MIICEHLITFDILKYRGLDECLLNGVIVFDLLDVVKDDKDMNGIYLICDKVRNIAIHSAATEKGFGKAYWKHKNESMLKK